MTSTEVTTILGGGSQIDGFSFVLEIAKSRTHVANLSSLYMNKPI